MMHASVLLMTVVLGGADAEEPVVRRSGLAGLISTATRPAAARRSDDVRSKPARDVTPSGPDADRRGASGGGADATQLIELIQTTVAPDCWQFSAGAPPAAANGSRTDELIELLRETIEPLSWDVYGGQGSISAFAP